MIPKRVPTLSVGLMALAVLPTSAPAINIVIDYTYDTNSFFSTQQRRDAMQAVADRYSSVITSSLAAVGPAGTTTGTLPGWRVGFTHPGTGNSFQLSTATDSVSDPLGGGADAYGFAGLNADEWVLFAGGRPLGSAGLGGTSTGLNYTSTFDDLDGPMHRGLGSNGTPSSGDLPRWGGAITFDTNTSWNFDLGSVGGGTDFYSIALHELGHALGLSLSWNDWQDDGSANYLGINALDAYNADHGTSLTSLDLESSTNMHWAEGTYDSYVFPGGATVGVVPDGTMQDLLMEPIANFGGSQQRFELTKVDVAALQDLGWEVVPEPSAAMLALLGLGGLLTRRRRR